MLRFITTLFLVTWVGGSIVMSLVVLPTLLMGQESTRKNNVLAYRIMLKFDGYKFLFSLYLLIYMILRFHFRSFQFALIILIVLAHSIIVVLITPRIKREIKSEQTSKKLNLYHVLALSSYWLQILFGLALLELVWMS